MPHTSSAKKALRKSQKRRLAHRAQRSALRTLLRRFRRQVGNPEVSYEEKEQLFRQVTKKLDQSAAKNLIHKNKASRAKSRLALLLDKARSS